MIDAAPVCDMTGDLGDVGALEGQVLQFSDSSGNPVAFTEGYIYVAPLNADAEPDLLWIELYAGYGVFSGGLATGTFEIAGDELSYATCGLCIMGRSNYNDTSGEYTQDWMAMSGTVTITSINGPWTATLANVSMAHVEIAGDLTTTVDPSCTEVPIAAASMDAPFPTP